MTFNVNIFRDLSREMGIFDAHYRIVHVTSRKVYNFVYELVRTPIFDIGDSLKLIIKDQINEI